MDSARKNLAHLGETEASARPEEWHKALELVRKMFCWGYLISSLKCLAESKCNLAFVIHQSRPMPFLRSPIGPAMFSITTGLVSGIAWWTLWKRLRSGRAWAIVLSLILILSYFTQFVFSIKSGQDRHLGALLLGIAGLAVFWPRKGQMDASSTQNGPQ
jgi:hypothetical protein